MVVAFIVVVTFAVVCLCCLGSSNRTIIISIAIVISVNKNVILYLIRNVILMYGLPSERSA